MPLNWPGIRLAVGVCAAIAVSTAPATGQAAGKREVRVDLSKYCATLNLSYAGWNSKTKKFTCGVLVTTFNTSVYTRTHPINLETVCRKYHKTPYWRFRGKKVWCVVAPPSTELEVCNQKVEPVWTAVSYYDSLSRRGEKGWVTQGWWQVAPGRCATPWRYNGYAGTLYVHGMTRSGSLPAPGARFCVHYGKAFKIPRSDTAACQQQNQKRVGMNKLSVHAGANRWTFK